LDALDLSLVSTYKHLMYQVACLAAMHIKCNFLQIDNAFEIFQLTTQIKKYLKFILWLIRTCVLTTVTMMKAIWDAYSVIIDDISLQSHLDKRLSIRRGNKLLPFGIERYSHVQTAELRKEHMTRVQTLFIGSNILKSMYVVFIIVNANSYEGSWMGTIRGNILRLKYSVTFHCPLFKFLWHNEITLLSYTTFIRPTPINHCIILHSALKLRKNAVA